MGLQGVRRTAEGRSFSVSKVFQWDLLPLVFAKNIFPETCSGSIWKSCPSHSSGLALQIAKKTLNFFLSFLIFCDARISACVGLSVWRCLVNHSFLLHLFWFIILYFWSYPKKIDTFRSICNWVLSFWVDRTVVLFFSSTHTSCVFHLLFCFFFVSSLALFWTASGRQTDYCINPFWNLRQGN